MKGVFIETGFTFEEDERVSAVFVEIKSDSKVLNSSNSLSILILSSSSLILSALLVLSSLSESIFII